MFSSEIYQQVFPDRMSKTILWGAVVSECVMVACFVSMCFLVVPVFVPVHSPDHSNANTYGGQYERAHREGAILNGEAGKKKDTKKM